MKSPIPLGLVLAISLLVTQPRWAGAQAPPLPAPPAIKPAGSPPPPPTKAPLAVPPPPAPAPSAPPAKNPEVNATPPFPVPPPKLENKAPPPLLPRIAARSGPPSAAQIQRLTPRVEVWRRSASAPQAPERHGHRLARAYITGNEPVVVRLQFDPLVAGTSVMVRPSNGVSVAPAEQALHIAPTGECVVSVTLDQSLPKGHIHFYCEGLMTTLPLSRASSSIVTASETPSKEGAR